MFIAQHANVYRRGNANLEELNEDEAVIYMQIVTVKVADVWSGMIQHKSGLISETNLAFGQHGRASGMNTMKTSANGLIAFPNTYRE